MAIDLTTLGIATDTTGMKPGIEDVKKLKDEAAKAAKEATALEKSMTAAVTKGVVFGNMIGDAVIKVAGLTVEFLRLGLSISKYQDLAEQTQSDPASLAALQVTADVAGVSIDNIAMAMARLSTHIAKANMETGPMASAIKGLGLQFSALKAMTPEEQYRALAVAFNGFADGATKAAYAQILFGLNGAMQLRVMKELAGQTTANNILTNEQIALADRTKDTLVRTGSEVRQFAQAFMANANPAIDAAALALSEIIREMIGTGSEATRLAKNKQMREWAFDTAEALSYLIDAAVGAKRSFEGIGIMIGGTAAALFGDTPANKKFEEAKKLRAQGLISLKEYQKAHQEMREAQKAMMAEVGNDMGAAFAGGPNLPDPGAEVRARISKAREATRLADMYEGLEGRRSDGGLVDTRAKLQAVATAGEEKAVRGAVSAYDQLMMSLDRKYEKELRSATLGRELTTIEKMTLDLESQMTAVRERAAAQKKKDPFSDQEVMAAYFKVQALAKAADVNDFRQASTKSEEREAAAAMKSAESYASKTEEYQKALNVMGLTKDGIDQIEASTMREAAAFILEKVAIQEMMGPLTEAGEARAKAMKAQAASMLTAADAATKLSVARSQRADEVDVDRRLAALQREGEQLTEHAALYGKNSEEIEKYNIQQLRQRATMTALSAVYEAAENQSSTLAKKLWEEADAIRAVAKQREDSLNQAIKDRGDPMAGAKKGLEAYVAEAKNVAKATEDVAYRVAKGIEDNLIEGIMHGKMAWGDLIEYMLQEALRLMVIKPMLAGIFGGSDGKGGLIGMLGLLGGGGGAASTGAEMSLAAGMSIGTFAEGGSPPVGKLSMVGERGPELFVPKTAGTIVPNDKISGGGGNSVTVIHNNTFGTGVSPSQLAQALEQNRAQTIAEVSDQIRRGSRRFS